MAPDPQGLGAGPDGDLDLWSQRSSFEREWAVALTHDVHGLLSVAEVVGLIRLARSMGPCNALEVGHWRGLSTAALRHGLEADAHLTTVDWHRGDRWAPPSDPATCWPVVAQPPNVTVVHDDALAWLDRRRTERRTSDAQRFHFLYYDGDHEPDFCRRFVAAVLPHLSGVCTVAYDDADWPETKAGLLPAMLEAGFREATPWQIDRRGEKGDPDCQTTGVLVRG